MTSPSPLRRRGYHGVGIIKVSTAILCVAKRFMVSYQTMRKLTLVFFLVLSLQCMAAMNREKPIYLKSKHAINITVTNAV